MRDLTSIINSNSNRAVSAMAKAFLPAVAGLAGLLVCGCATTSPLRVSTYDDVLRVLDSGYTADATDKSGETMLHYAASSTNTAEAKRIIELLVSKGADVNARDRFGRTPLYDAQDPATAEQLLDAGADASVQDRWRRTPLHAALKNSWGSKILDMVRVYLSRGTDVNAHDIEGNAPLHYAASSTNTAEAKQIIGLLLSKGADVNARDKFGRTPLYNARDPATAEQLLDAGADASMPDQRRCTPLHMALKTSWGSKRLDMVRVYLSRGTDVNAQDIEGNTPLHYATGWEMFDELIAHGADPYVVNKAGVSALAVQFHPIYTGPQKRIESLSFIRILDSASGNMAVPIVEIRDRPGSNVLYKASPMGEGADIETAFQALPGSYDISLGCVGFVGFNPQNSSITMSLSSMGRTNLETRPGVLYSVICNTVKPRTPLSVSHEPFPPAKKDATGEKTGKGTP